MTTTWAITYNSNVHCAVVVGKAGWEGGWIWLWIPGCCAEWQRGSAWWHKFYNSSIDKQVDIPCMLVKGSQYNHIKLPQCFSCNATMNLQEVTSTPLGVEKRQLWFLVFQKVQVQTLLSRKSSGADLP